MKSIIIAFASICLLTNCSRTLYVPNSLNMPLLEKKNDFNGNIAMRYTGPFNTELQAGYAPLDHFVVTLSGMSVSGNNFLYKTKNDFVEAGAGVFHAISWGDDPDMSLRMELIGGYGLGKGSSKKRSGDARSEGGFQRKYLQEAIGFKSKHVDVSLGIRVAEVNFSSYSDYNDNNLTDRGIYDFSTVEPVMSLAVGGRGFKVYSQFGFTLPSKDSLAFNEAVGNPLYNFMFFGGFTINKFDKPASPKPAFSLEPADTNSQAPKPITLQIYHDKCWVCLRQKGSTKHSTIDLGYNGAPWKEGIRLNKSFTCLELGLISGQNHLLNIQRSTGTTGELKPLEVFVRDGKVERRFFLNLQAGEAEEIRLHLASD